LHCIIEAIINCKKFKPLTNFKNGFMELDLELVNDDKGCVFAVPCPEQDQYYLKKAILRIIEKELFDACVEFFTGLCVEKMNSEKGPVIVVKDSLIDVSDVSLLPE
jgi:hypothetical protein